APDVPAERARQAGAAGARRGIDRLLEEPVDAVLEVAAQLDLDYLRLDLHLQRHHVEALDHVADRLPGGRVGPHQQRIGLFDRGHADLGAFDLERDRAIAVGVARIERHAFTKAAGGSGPGVGVVPAVPAGHLRGAAAGIAVVVELHRLQARHERRRTVAIGGTAGAVTEHLRQAIGEILGLDVLELVRIELHTASGAVDAIEPLLDVVEVVGLRRDHQYRVGSLQRHEAEHAGDGRLAVLAEHLFEIGNDLACLARAQREYADRHPRKPVDVEDLDRAQVVLEFGARARHADDVACVVDVDHGIGTRVRLEHLLHLGGGDVAQRDGAHFITPCERCRTRARRDGATGECLVGGDDVVAAAAVDQAGVVPAQHHFQQVQRFGRTDRLGRAQRDRALDPRGDHVVLPEHVAQDGLDHRLQRFALEVEGCAATGGRQRGWRGGGGFAIDDLAAATADLRTWRGLIRGQWLRAADYGVAGRWRSRWRGRARGGCAARLDVQRARVGGAADVGHRCRRACGQGERDRGSDQGLAGPERGMRETIHAGTLFDRRFLLLLLQGFLPQLSTARFDALADGFHLRLFRRRRLVGRGGGWRGRCRRRDDRGTL